MQEDAEDLAIVKGVIGLAQAFNRSVIAEGVESVAHGDILLSLGCKHAQGYGIARAMPADEFAPWLGKWQAPPSWRGDQLNCGDA
jgi:EAL domain-containing protein (putative c-di-GMP-specific phosphodiesterase class I)